MRDSREKGAGMRDQDPPPPPQRPLPPSRPCAQFFVAKIKISSSKIVAQRDAISELLSPNLRLVSGI